MGDGEANLELTVKYKDIEAKFTGKPGDVMRAFFNFMSKALPAYDFASDLILTVDLEKLLRSVRGLIAFTPEGVVITVSREKIGGDRNMILLNLIKAYIGYKTDRLERDSLSMAEIIASTGGKSRTIAARLSELTGMGLVERVGRGEYRVTTLGVKFFLDEVLPKVKPEEEVKVE